MKSSFRYDRRTVYLCLALTLVWAAIPLTGLLSTDASGTTLQCPNGPLSADLSGESGTSGKAMFREKGSNRLAVNVKGVTADTRFDVFIADTKVGTIAVGKSRNGQLRLDTTTATIDEGTAISVRNGTTTVLSGTFQCVAGGPSSSPTTVPTTSPTTVPTTSATTMPTTSPTTMPTTSPTTMPTTSPTTMPTGSPTGSPAPKSKP